MKQSKKNQIIEKGFLAIAVLLLIYIAFVSLIKPNLKTKPKALDSHCKEAVCNENKTLCYAYDLDEEGATKIVWRGSCTK